MAFIRKSYENKTVKPPSLVGMNTPSELLEFAKNNNVCLSPLDVSKLTGLLGIVMRMEPLSGEDSGSLKKDPKTGQWVMTVNSLHHPNRQRFTIAHELGHFIKHGLDRDFFTDQVFFRNGESNSMEIEANRFAAELLMPEEKFASYVEKSSQKVADIAEYFGVSSMAVRIRAQQLGFEGHNL